MHEDDEGVPRGEARRVMTRSMWVNFTFVAYSSEGKR